MINKFLLLTLFFGLSGNCLSQIAFDTLGRISELKSNKTPIPDSVIKNKVRQLKDRQYNASINLVKKNYIEVQNLFNDEHYKKFLITYIGQKNYDAWLALYKDSLVNTPFGKTLTNWKGSNYVYVPEKKIIYRLNLFDKSMVSTFNSLYTSEYKKLKLTKTTLKALSSHIISQKDTLAKAKIILSDSSQPKTFEIFYAWLYNKLKLLDTTKSRQTKVDTIAEILRSNWVRDWLWVKKGQIVLNPFEFTSKEFVSFNVKYDETKIGPYNKFIQSVIDSTIKRGKWSDFDNFKAALKEKDSGEKLYSNRADYDTLVAQNERLLKRIAQHYVGLNKISPESLTSDSYIIDASPNDTIITGNNDALLTEPMRIGTDKQKIVSVINVRKNVKIFLNKQVKEIPDKSTFQLAFDSIVSQAGVLAAQVSVLSPIVATFDKMNTKSNFIIKDAKEIKPKPEIVKIKGEEYMKFITLYSMNEAKMVKENRRTKKSPVQLQLEAFFKATGTDFSQKNLDTLAPELILVKIKKIEDSLEEALAQKIYDYETLTEIFCNVTLPPSIIPTEYNDDVLFSTITTTLTVPAKPSESYIKVQRIQKTDTFTLKDFSYRSGKTYRILLSAGIEGNPAYNNKSFVQTTISKSDGKLTVTNTTQPYLFFAGINIHLGKKGLFMQADKLNPKKHFWGRVSVFTGVGITKMPLDNLYGGFAYDIVPGLKINLMAHGYRNDKFTISNDEVVYQKMKYKLAPSIGISIDPISLTKTLTNLVKLTGK